MRGKHISVPMEQIILQAKNLARIGVKELILISQELTYYGLDLYKKRMLQELLYALSEVEGIEWIRLQYAYPSKFPLEIIDAMVKLPKVCNYLDIPLQHASDRILDLMKRQITLDQTRSLIQEIRQINPAIAIRTTFLVGFPGETDQDFDILCDFVREMQFERVGVFQYSHEEDTSAFEMEDDIDPEVKSYRANRLMEIQQEISWNINQQKIGKIFKVIIDKKESGSYFGRTEYDSYEVDNEVIIDAAEFNCEIGQYYDVEIFDATEYDLYGKVLN